MLEEPSPGDIGRAGGEELFARRFFMERAGLLDRSRLSTELRRQRRLTRQRHAERIDRVDLQPRGLRGEEIPIGSRIIIVADAYEAMTSDRIYRKAIGHDRAMEQLNKYKGVQFDPRVVRALEALLLKRGPGAFEVSDLPPINYETLAELRRRLAQEPLIRDAHAG